MCGNEKNISFFKKIKSLGYRPIYSRLKEIQYKKELCTFNRPTIRNVCINRLNLLRSFHVRNLKCNTFNHLTGEKKSFECQSVMIYL